MIFIRYIVFCSVVVISCISASADSAYDLKDVDRSQKLSRIGQKRKQSLSTQGMHKHVEVIAPPMLTRCNEPSYNLALAPPYSSAMNDPVVVPEASAFVLTGSGVFGIPLAFFARPRRRRWERKRRESCLLIIGS
jgi:hypothetical protein